MKTFLIAAFILIGIGACAQNIYPEKVGDCGNEGFIFERDTSNAKIGNVELLSFFKDNITPEILARIDGGLSLQILVDTAGKSCLLSVENKTNVTMEELGLKKAMDEKLVWGPPSEQVSVVLLVSFSEGGFEIKRLGNDAVRGWHQLMF